MRLGKIDIPKSVKDFVKEWVSGTVTAVKDVSITTLYQEYEKWWEWKLYPDEAKPGVCDALISEASHNSIQNRTCFGRFYTVRKAKPKGR